MKVPRLWPCLLLLCAAVSATGRDAVIFSADATAMRAAAEQGPDHFLTAARMNGWSAPTILSRWRAEKLAAPARRSAAQAARDLGGTLARQLAEFAPKIHALPPGEELRRTAATLCGLAEWCATTEGYGNALLAQRALDLAAVGVARLAADETFPLEQILPLAARLRQPLADAAARRRILNTEADAELFAVATQAGLEQTWAAGARDDAPELLRAHRKFFTDERPGRGESVTLAVTWERKWHERIVDGLDLRSVALAVALVEFRRTLGKFPHPATAAASAPSAATAGPAAGLQLVTSERAPSTGQRAFQQAWQRSAAAASSGRTADGLRLPDAAWEAFDAVAQGAFIDQDTRSEKFGPGVR